MTDRRNNVPDKDEQMDDVHAPYKEEEVELPAAGPDHRDDNK